MSYTLLANKWAPSIELIELPTLADLKDLAAGEGGAMGALIRYTLRLLGFRFSLVCYHHHFSIRINGLST